MNTKIIASIVCKWLMLAVLANAIYANQQSDLVKIAKNIADGVGVVGECNSTGVPGPIFVFEEYHTSRVGQLEIAIMMCRLHNLYGMKQIGLEGSLQRLSPLKAQWFHRAGNPSTIGIKEDVAVRLLAEGEIRAAEFIALVFPDVGVFGTEIAGQYDVRLDIDVDPGVNYLLRISEKLLSQNEISKINKLMEQDKSNEALEVIKNCDPWIRRQFEVVQSDSLNSVRRILEYLRKIKSKANMLGVTVETSHKQAMDKSILFYETAAKRELTMVNYVIEQMVLLSDAPTAMTIGAAHTENVLELLNDRNAAYVRITPNSLNPDYGNMTMEQFERKNDQKWARINPGTLGLLLNNDRNPPPMIETATSKSYASMNLAALLVAEAARGGMRIPEDILPQLDNLPEFRIDRSSFIIEGYDVIFRAWLKNTGGYDQEVWARVGTMDTPEKAQSLEDKLMQAIVDLGGEGYLPPRKPPYNSKGTTDEGPGDGMRGDVVINRVGLRTLAVYSATKNKVVAVGRLSG